MLLERCSLARLGCAKVDVFGAKPRFCKVGPVDEAVTFRLIGV